MTSSARSKRPAGATARPTPERVDVVVVGARCAGSAAAIALARLGRSVIAIDRTRFPSDTLSTHVNFPSAVAEVQRLGALQRIQRECDPPKALVARIVADGVSCSNRWEPIDGIDYAQSVPRWSFDHALVETAREAGVDVRERTTLLEVLWRDGRACGVRVRGPEGEYEVACALVVGADGRRSAVAGAVGAERPYRGSLPQRGAAYRYMDDPQLGTEWRSTVVQFRQRESHVFVFPCPEDRMLVLFMGAREDVSAFRADPEGTWAARLAENPAAAERVGAGGDPTKIRSTTDTASYFRRSSGPGWALCGDAGHFKDPAVGQGIRDALRFGRLLGEGAAPVLDDPRRLDAALAAVERRRDRECRATYHWGNKESRLGLPSPLFKEALRAFDGFDGEPWLARLFDRGGALGATASPHRILSPWRGAKLAARAALRPGVDRRALLREVVEELRIDADVWREEWADRFRDDRPRASERPIVEWPERPPHQVRGEVAAPLDEAIDEAAGAVPAPPVAA
ncbi:NAD(P)/FAD-dependent oxidoreductase [Patulibacter defluvii]|uniref:NAD(P)/FAD-dependent oxidoreductase n=1 Tax=Patulibacter defluvii TaxID=3095358 RepID=UPI002A74E3D0|nr:FAD-dependent monooxygenase [Patulibacter sp. DM4]